MDVETPEDDDNNNVVANRKAIEFLQSITFKDLSKAIFDDHLALLSKDGTQIGELNISIEETIRDGEVCYLVQTHSYYNLDGVPSGSSITAHISRGMKTLDMQQHEYTEVGGKEEEKKTILIKDGTQFVIKKSTKKGDTNTEIERIYSYSALMGYISDAATIILERIMCVKDAIPESACFLSLDRSLSLVTMEYEKQLDAMLDINGERVHTLGIDRQTKGMFSTTVIESRFLGDGHLASQTVQKNAAEIQMKLLVVPTSTDDCEGAGGGGKVAEREDLPWQEDMMLHSYFLDRKEELKNNHESYLRQKPELQAMLKDFLQFVLLRKPDDICEFASNYFGLLAVEK